ncbi:TetR/AcrR family transcriptional regulator [uncultured Roseibium sp.]|uniref:TetR/AcrR family transcriptional regulator n=1 Tax=uncultured Roseibium sp. TaxID=1936171 RepID=UPI002614584B|nr:TetR/AcrR family transcriptional regulator [uncultured Roseibium sp.]
MTGKKIQKKSAYHHGDLRGQLIAAARRLIEEHGPDGFSMSDACRLAGVSTAAPYRHFSSKNDLLTDVAKDGLQRLGAEMEQSASEHPRGSIESISAIGRVYVAFAIREPHTFRLMFSTRSHSGRIEELKQVGRGCYGVLLAEVARYLGEDDITEWVIKTAFPLWTQVHGLSFLAIDGKLDVTSFPVDINDAVLLATQRLLPPQDERQKP